METFRPEKQLIEDPDYAILRNEAIEKLDYGQIDVRIIEIIRRFSRLPYCFTIQCCEGHFVSDNIVEHDPKKLPETSKAAEIEYRIAYLALCIENSENGRKLLDEMRVLPLIDQEYIQFGSPDWFWESRVNTYAAQVEPDRFKNKDTAMVGLKEAVHLKNVRDKFFRRIEEMLGKRPETRR